MVIQLEIVRGPLPAEPRDMSEAEFPAAGRPVLLAARRPVLLAARRPCFRRPGGRCAADWRHFAAGAFQVRTRPDGRDFVRRSCRLPGDGNGSVIPFDRFHHVKEDAQMLVLSRKKGESLVIDGRIRITVSQLGGSTVRLAIEAPAKCRSCAANCATSSGWPARYRRRSKCRWHLLDAAASGLLAAHTSSARRTLRGANRRCWPA